MNDIAISQPNRESRAGGAINVFEVDVDTACGESPLDRVVGGGEGRREWSKNNAENSAAGAVCEPEEEGAACPAELEVEEAGRPVVAVRPDPKWGPKDLLLAMATPLIDALGCDAAGASEIS